MFSNLYRKITHFLLLLGVGFSMILVSCNDFLNVESKRIAKEDQQWSTLEDTRAALMGVYGLMRAALVENNAYWICGDLRGGDFSVSDRLDLQAVVDNNLNEPFPIMKEISNWRRFYAVINAASIFIEKAPGTFEKDKSYSEENLMLDIAQARVLRAFAYFNMVRIWGDVPLVTYSYDNGSFPRMERTDASLVLSYAKEELENALTVLPFQLGSKTSLYYGKEGKDWQGILLNKLSVYAILAHIAAWEGNYLNAETYAAYIMDNASRVEAKYIGVADLTSSQGLFLTNSDWRVSRIVGLTFDHNESEASQNGHLEELTLAAPLVQKSTPDIYVSKDSLFSIFNNVDDQRFGIDSKSGKYYTSYVHNVESQYPIFSKIKVIQNGNPTTNDYAIFGSALVFSRLEDITLLRAEALCAINQPEQALVHLNTIRTARGMSAVSYKKDFNSDKSKVIQAVFEERRKELMGEGWRWYDRIRQEKLLNNDTKLRKLINEGGIYWPIDQDILTNSMIEQNTYWQ